MKKTSFIILGILLIVIVLGIWAYLFIFGSPNDGEGGIFTNFGIGNNEPVVTDTNPSVVDTAPIDQSGNLQRLRQLTANPVAGAVFVPGGIRYVERGTGHIYDIMLSTGNETRISSFTIARVVDALFSPDGTRVVITTEGSTGSEIYIGEVPEIGSDNTELTGIFLPSGAREVAFSEDGTGVFYLNDTPSGASGYSYSIKDEESTRIFTIPLRDVRMLWGSPNYVYTTPTDEQVGFIYRISSNNLVPVADRGVGLTAFSFNEGLIVASEKSDLRFATIYRDRHELPLLLHVLPEKCTDDTSSTSTVICADPSNTLPDSLVDAWYKGSVSYIDSLWEVNIETGEVSQIVDLLLESGREIDVVKIGTNETGEFIYFINKNDDSLWMFDTTL